MAPKITYIGTVDRVPWCRLDAQGNWLYEVRFTPSKGESGEAGNHWVRDPELGETTPSRCGELWPNVWIYKGKALRVDGDDLDFTPEEILVRIEHALLKRKQRHERMKAEVAALKNLEHVSPARRDRIPEAVQIFVWQRDQGQCVQCGGREKLEFDHIIPVAEGGSSTERNVQLLCEACNRRKGKSIGY
jgi:hypothetical protein